VKLQPKTVRMTDEVYGSLVYDGAPLLRVHLCGSRAFLVKRCYLTGIAQWWRHSLSMVCGWSEWV